MADGKPEKEEEEEEEEEEETCRKCGGNSQAKVITDPSPKLSEISRNVETNRQHGNAENKSGTAALENGAENIESFDWETSKLQTKESNGAEGEGNIDWSSENRNCVDVIIWLGLVCTSCCYT